MRLKEKEEGENTMSPRTVFLSKLFGIYYIFAALSMILHKQRFVGTVTALLHDASVMFLVGILTLLGGLALVLAHNVWSRGALAMVVTFIGWITLVKGLLFLFLAPEMEAEFFLTKLNYDSLFYMYAAISLVLGVYLVMADSRQPRILEQFPSASSGQKPLDSGKSKLFALPV